jgi:hypothetical protein
MAENKGSEPDKLSKLDRLLDRCNRHSTDIASKTALFGTLGPELNDELVGTTDDIRSEFEDLRSEFEASEEETDEIRYKIRYCNEVVLPYVENVLDSQTARLRLARPGFKDSKTLYELNLAADCLDVSDVDGALETYHRSVNDFLNLQKECSNVGIHLVNVSNVTEYKRVCDSILLELDALATSIFGKKILTPANFDVKEQNPHQFLGAINVGFENTMPNILRVLAHEGSLGHNTHQLLSVTEPIFSLNCRHTTEGLAILGEFLALEKKYGSDAQNSHLVSVLSDKRIIEAAVDAAYETLAYHDRKSEKKMVTEAIRREILASKKKHGSDEQNNHLVSVLTAKRIMEDSLGAAYERLVYYDRKSEKEIVAALESRLYPKERLTQNLDGLERRRDISFSVGAAYYFAGFSIIRDVHQNALETVRGMGKDAKETNAIMNGILTRMYSGQRPASIIENYITDYLDFLKEQDSVVHPSTAEKNGDLNTSEYSR